jgi:hypothetical protein
VLDFSSAFSHLGHLPTQAGRPLARIYAAIQQESFGDGHAVILDSVIAEANAV